MCDRVNLQYVYICLCCSVQRTPLELSLLHQSHHTYIPSSGVATTVLLSLTKIESCDHVASVLPLLQQLIRNCLAKVAPEVDIYNTKIQT